MSQKAKPTPGPWKWTPGDESCHSELHQEGFAVGEADSILYHGADWSISEANARLIAAAPSMEKLLRGIIGDTDLDDGECRFCGRVYDTEENGPLCGFEECDSTEARALLARIEGEG